jgi:integrase
MPRPRSLKPKLCRHKSSNRAYVSLSGKIVYLGAFGSREAQDRYDVEVARWIADGRQAVITIPDDPAAGVTVSQVVAAFWKHATGYYGTSGELDNFKLILSPLRRLYGSSPAAAFGPKKLKALREHFIGLGWSRDYLNRHVGRVKQVFAWATAEELIPASVYHGLQSVKGLRFGHTQAREADPVLPVPIAHVNAALPFMPKPVQNMVKLQLLCGARPGELCSMRSADIDTTGKPWLYKPASHKTRHHGHARVIRFGPAARDLLAPLLRKNLTEFIFRPDEAEAERRAMLREDRETPETCGNVPGSNCVKCPERRPGERYTRHAYARAIARACEKAFQIPADIMEPRTEKMRKLAAEARLMTPEKIAERKRARSAWRREHVWHPHQLRHNFATDSARVSGIEMSQTLLGHALGSKMTAIYAEKNADGANALIEKIG